MKKVKLLALLISAAALLSACSGTSTSSATSATSGTVASDTEKTENSAVSSVPQTEEEIKQAMIERSLMTTGNLERMSAFIDKVEAGKEVTVAFIGGSITEGIAVTPDKCWAKLFYDYLTEKYQGAKINYVNAGMSGTPSVLGNIRLYRDVMDYSPDLVFVEFAVNDGNNPEYKDSYDAMVREILESEKSPAVALYFTVIKSGHTCEGYMSKVGEAYGLPMVSLNNALKPEFESERMKWEDYSSDESHPNEYGNILTNDLLKYMYEQVEKEVKEKKPASISPLPSEWVYSKRFMDMILVDREYNKDSIVFETYGGFRDDKETISQFKNGWYAKGKPSECAPMKFSFEGSSLMLIYRCSTSAKFGMAKVIVDGKEMGAYSTSASDGWNNPVAVPVFTGENGRHNVEISIVGDKGADTDLYLEILGFGIAHCDGTLN